MTAPESTQRVSHELLMQAQQTLSEASKAERDAGNRGVAMVLNELVLTVFRVALSSDLDETANRAYDERYGVTP